MSRPTAAQEHFFTPGLPGIALPDCTCGAASSGMGGSHYGRCPRYCPCCAYLTDCGPTHAEMNELFYGRGARAYSKSGRKNNVEVAEACEHKMRVMTASGWTCSTCGYEHCAHKNQRYIWKESGQWRCKDCGELV